MTASADRLLCLPLALAALVGCVKAAPVILHGDANSVEISHVGSLAAAGPLALRHCSQFEKLARFISSDGETVLFDCVRR